MGTICSSRTTSASRQPIEPQPTVAQEAASLAPSTDKTSLPDEQNTPSANAQLLKSLYDELQEFKSDPEFHDVGFAVCCRFNKWFARVGELQEQSDMNLFREVGVVPGELRQLGLEYMRSKGEPNSYTRSMEPKFKDGFAKHNYNPNISQRRYSGQQKLSANEFPGKWPLTVEEGTLFCEPLTRGARPMGRIAFRAPDGTTYAVNGTAQPKYPRIDPIWRSDPEIPGAEIYIGDLMEAGHALCD